MTEPTEVRLRRLRMRSWRRGMREIDLMLGPFADAALAALDPATLDAFEALLAAADGDLHRWLIGVDSIPRQHVEMVDRIRAHHRTTSRWPPRPGP